MDRSQNRRYNLVFLRFHLAVGIRLALKCVSPILAAAFAVYYILGPEFMEILAIGLFSNSGLLLPAIFFGALSVSAALISSRRICLGSTGWIRQLPSTARTRRRSSGLAVFLAIFPVLALQSIFTGMALSSFEFKTLLPFFLGLIGLNLAGAQAVLPVEKRPIVKTWAGLAGLGFMSGLWLGLLFGGFSLIMSDRFAGSLVSLRREQNIYLKAPGSLLPFYLNWRALKFRLLSAYVPAFIILGLTLLFIKNNDLAAGLLQRAVLFGASLSGVVFIALLTNFLAAVFPPWPWSRSLPWS